MTSSFGKLREIARTLKDEIATKPANKESLLRIKSIIESLIAEATKRKTVFIGIPRIAGKDVLRERWMETLKFAGEPLMEVHKKAVDDAMVKARADDPSHHFKRAEIVFERFVEEGTSLKRYRFKEFINIATERELPIEYKHDTRTFFYCNRDGNELCVKNHYDQCNERWFSCIPLNETELTQKEYDEFLGLIRLAGERLHRIMECKRDLARHKGEIKITI